MKFCSLLILLCSILGPIVQSANSESRNAHPNVLLIFTDDHRYTGVHALGGQAVHTPHLDQLYAESIRFTDSHVNPFCAPTRAVPPAEAVEQDRWKMPAYRALPVASVPLQIGQQRWEEPVPRGATVVAVEVPREVGPINVRARLLNAKGEEIAGAYYVYVSVVKTME